MENKKKQSRKSGRPVKGNEKLSISINLKLTEDDYKTVKEKAERLGMKATQYAREMTLKGGIKSRFTLVELDQMRKLAGMANKSGFSNSAMEVMIISGEIKKLLYDR